MSKTLNMLFEVGGSRLYDTLEEADKALVSAGFLKEENGEYRLYPSEDEVDEEYQSGWIKAEIRLVLNSYGDYTYCLSFEFMV